MWDAGVGGRGWEQNPNATLARRLPPHEHHLADSWYNSTGGWAGAAAEIQWKKLSVLQPGDASFKNIVKHLGAWYPYKLLATRSWCSDVAKASSAAGCLHGESFTVCVPELYEHREYRIPFVFSWWVLCRDSTVLREKHWTGAWKPFAWMHGAILHLRNRIENLLIFLFFFKSVL